MKQNSGSIGSLTMEVEAVRKASPKVRIYQDKSFFAQLMGKTKPYKSLPDKVRPALEGIAEYYTREMVPAVFNREGPGWAPLSPRTMGERAAQGFGASHPILRRTGDLMAELSERSHPSHVEIIKVGKNSRIEIGGSSKKFRENQTGVSASTSHLPARPMLPGTGTIPIHERDRMQMRDIVEKALKQQLKKGA